MLLLQFEDVGFVLELVKWIVLGYMAFYLYNWTQEHLPFSPTLALAVGAVLIYYLVLEHPFFGAFGIFGWILISSGFLFMAGTLFPWIGVLFYRMKKGT